MSCVNGLAVTKGSKRSVIYCCSLTGRADSRIMHMFSAIAPTGKHHSTAKTCGDWECTVDFCIYRHSLKGENGYPF